VVNAVIGFWATLSLNISDFTRFSRSQAAQFRGQFFGLPVFMAGFSVVSVIVTGCCAKAYGDAGSHLDPASIAALAGAGHPAIVACSCVGLILATLSTNIAANVVAPANAFANAWPSRITFFRGALLTATVGTALAPWRLAGDAAEYLFVWLGGYGADARARRGGHDR
jgi:NCS1 family nucleobase:cation symporter-1